MIGSKRERAQLVVSLGEGERGAERRELLEQAAFRARVPVSTWARTVLCEAAQRQSGPQPADPLGRVLERLAELEARVKDLERAI